jgi:hypothetical protein
LNLIWREFEKKWRALYRAELQRQPQLQKEIKRRRKPDSKALPQLARRALIPAFWCSVFVSVTGKAETELAAAALALWAAGAAFRWGHQWFQQFYASEDLVVLNFLPLEDSQIFWFQLRRYLTSAGWLLWELGLAYSALALIDMGNGPPIYLLVPAGLLQALLVVALALHLASWVHMVPLGTLGVLLRLSAIALLVFGAQRPDLTSYLTQSTEWFLPTGWVNYALFHGGQDRVVYVLVIPILALIYLARYSFARLRSFYSLAGVEIVPARSAGGANDEELTGENAGPRPGPTEIEDRLLARRFLEGVNWELSGPIEKFVARCLTARQRVITEFLVAANPGWTHALKVSFWIWLATSSVVLTLGHFGGTIIFFSAYILATATLPLFGGEWRGMRQSASGGMYLPAFSVFPITFNAMALIFLKVNLVRIAASTPFILSFAALAAYRLSETPLAGVQVAAKLMLILMCVQPISILLPISHTTNFTANKRSAIKLLILIPAALILLGAAFAVFVSTTLVGVLTSYAVLMLTSILLLTAFKHAYRRGEFDLLTERSPRR